MDYHTHVRDEETELVIELTHSEALRLIEVLQAQLDDVQSDEGVTLTLGKRS